MLFTWQVMNVQVISVESEHDYLQWSVKANNRGVSMELLNTKMTEKMLDILVSLNMLEKYAIII